MTPASNSEARKRVSAAVVLRDTALDVDAIETRADKATPEPWVFHDITLYIGGMTADELHEYDAAKDPDDSTWKDAVDSFEPNRAEDGEFIAHARADVFHLIDRVRQLERALASALGGAA